jgi:DNA repair exonuclease SbcCD nuclease subunit
MCGDIHKRGGFTYKNIPIMMPSSLIQQNFGENISNHGFLLWDVESRTYTEHDVENKSQFYQFKIKSLDDLENGDEKLTNA